MPCLCTGIRNRPSFVNRSNQCSKTRATEIATQQPFVGQPRRLPFDPRQAQRLPYNFGAAARFSITFSMPLTTSAKRL